MRVEIPYSYIIRVLEFRDDAAHPRAVPKTTTQK